MRPESRCVRLLGGECETAHARRLVVPSLTTRLTWQRSRRAQLTQHDPSAPPAPSADTVPGRWLITPLPVAISAISAESSRVSSRPTSAARAPGTVFWELRAQRDTGEAEARRSDAYHRRRRKRSGSGVKGERELKDEWGDQ